MKTQVRFLIIAAALAALAFGFATCGDETGIYEAGTEAGLSGVQIKSVYVAVAPDPIDSFDYEDEGFDLEAAPHETAALNRSDDTLQVRFRPAVSRGARVEWGIGTQDMRPFTYFDVRIPATFDADDFVYFKVTSEDGFVESYYRYYIWVRSPVTELAEMYVGKYVWHTETETRPDPDFPDDPEKATEVEVVVVEQDERMFADIAAPGSTHLNAGAGALYIRDEQKNNAEVVATRFDGSSTIEYAVAPNGNVVPEFGTNNVFNLQDNTYLYIRITAQNTVDVAIYKFRVWVGRISFISSLTFIDSTNSPAVEYPVVSWGTPRSQTNWGTVAYGNYKTADMPAVGFDIAIETEDPNATAKWTLIANKSASAPADSVYGTGGKAIFTGTNVLVIKVTSHNGQANLIYKIEVELLAANFLKQPVSNYYYYYDANAKAPNPAIDLYDHLGLTVDGTEAAFSGAHGSSSVAPLTVQMDRTGNFTYQWWHANSWYGAYGFDEDDNIGYVAFDGPDGARQEHWGSFKQDTWYRRNLDEKGNTSLFNGGNWFVFEVPGKPITGATNLSYTPSIDKVPLIGGSTSATHYYWVVVTDTDTQRTATSKRTAIITEWDPNKKHYIINLNEDLWEQDGTDKKYYSARNPKVFTYHREKYTFPIALDSSFNISDYSIATAQALFFLRDGTPWVQNWTQGDIGFENDTGPLVLYYNLTNNNATLGLVGGGKEPSGGSLTKNPTKITIKPAGEKATTLVPSEFLPSSIIDSATGLPNNRADGDAQGWFTGFIEIVELHFEGPAQPAVEP